MRHSVKKIKFKYGRDSHRMLVRKLVRNFLLHGTITTTEKKVKVLKSVIERMAHKSKEQTQAHKNYLLQHLGDEKIVNFLFEQVGPVIKKISGGYVTYEKLQERASDGALTVKMRWAYPVVMKDKKKEQTKEMATKKKSTVKTAQS